MPWGLLVFRAARVMVVAFAQLQNSAAHFLSEVRRIRSVLCARAAPATMGHCLMAAGVSRYRCSRSMRWFQNLHLKEAVIDGRGYETMSGAPPATVFKLVIAFFHNFTENYEKHFLLLLPAAHVAHGLDSSLFFFFFLLWSCVNWTFAQLESGGELEGTKEKC